MANKGWPLSEPLESCNLFIGGEFHLSVWLLTDEGGDS